MKPASTFDGEVFFTQVLPRWCLPSSKSKKKRKSDKKETVRNTSTKAKRNNAAADYSDDEDGSGHADQQTTNTDNNEGKKYVRGVHHPKFFLLFERSGSLVVIISTSNLTPQSLMDGSWVQRFEPKGVSPHNRDSGNNDGNLKKGSVYFGMPSDFGAVLTDFLKKQSDAAAGCAMMPDVFLR